MTRANGQKIKFLKLSRKLQMLPFIAGFAAIGVIYLVITHAAPPPTIVQLDNGDCVQDLEIGSNQAASSISTPSFLLFGDGASAKYQVSIDNNPIGTFSAYNTYGYTCITTTARLADGSHQLTAQELYPNPSNVVTPFNFIVDATPLAVPPTPSLDPGSETGQGANETANAFPQIDGTSVPNTQVRLVVDGNNSGVANVNSSGAWNESLSNMPAGMHMIAVESQNPAGLDSAPSPSLPLNIDPTPPIVSITNPASNATVSGNATISGTAADINQLTSVTVQIDNNPAAAASGTTSWSIPILTSDYPNGAHTITVVATDLGGRSTTTSEIVNFSNTVQTSTPVISITQPTTNATLSGTTPLVASVSDTGATISNVQFFINGNLIGSVTSVPYSFNWDSTSLVNGAYTLSAKATDSIGNTATAAGQYTTIANPPIVPTGVTATITGLTQATITWNPTTDPAAAGVTSYSILRSTNGGSYLADGNVSATTLSYIDTGLASNTTYSYEVEASSGQGFETLTSKPSSPASVTSLNQAYPTPPNTPTGLTATSISSSEIDLNWSPSASYFGVTGYEVYRNGQPDLSTPNTSVNDIGLTPGNYTYYVVAYNSGGDSAESNSASAITVGANPPAITINSPTNGATVSGSVAIDTTDTDPAGIGAIVLYVDGAYQSADTSPPYNFTWNSTAVGNGTHNILVEALSDDDTVNSLQVNVNVSNGSPVSFTTPVLSATSSVYNQVNLSWSPSVETGGSGVVGYYIMRGTTNVINNSTTIQKTTTTATTYTDNSVPGTGTYYYWVMAYDGSSNNSTPSASAQVITPPAPNSVAPTPPPNVTAVADSDSEITVSWGPASDTNGQVIGYNIYYEGSTTPLNGGTLIPVASPTVTYGDTNLTPSTPYSYYVEAVNAGKLSSTPSTPPANASTLPAPPPTTTTVTGYVTTVLKKKSIPLENVTVSTNMSGAGGTTTALTDPVGHYTLANIVSNQPHKYTFTLKKYKTKSVDATYPVGIITLSEILKAK